MTIDDMIKDEKSKYDINRETTKISALLSGKINQYEYLTGKKILLTNQSQMIEDAKFAYFPLAKVFGKQKEKQVDDALKFLKLSNKIYDLN